MPPCAPDTPTSADAPLDRILSLEEGAAAGCVFCRIVRGELPSTVLYENDDAYVFADLHPAAPFHGLVVPRRHIPRLDACDASHEALLGRLMATVHETARARGLSDYRVIINNGPGAGQTVPHLHLHILGGAPLGERLV